MRNDEPDALDRLLDEALGRYSNAEPLAGIEQRVMQRVRADSAPRRFGVGGWVWAIPVAAAALMLAMAGFWKGTAPAPAPAPHIAAVGKPEAGHPPVARVSMAHQPGRHAWKRQVRRPAPLSREERALLELVTNSPEQARAAFADLERQSTEPIRIVAIQIEPLRNDDAK